MRYPAMYILQVESQIHFRLGMMQSSSRMSSPGDFTTIISSDFDESIISSLVQQMPTLFVNLLHLLKCELKAIDFNWLYFNWLYCILIGFNWLYCKMNRYLPPQKKKKNSRQGRE